MEARSFEILYEQTSKPLLLYILRTTCDKQLSDDVFQEAYIRLLQSELKSLNDAQMRSYLFTTATNIVRDHWRRSRKGVPWESVSNENLTENHLEEQTDLHRCMEDALGKLSPQQRSLLWLAYVEGYEHIEIAGILNLRQKSVRVLLFRAKQKLIRILNEMGLGKEESR